MWITIDNNSKIPLFRQIYQQIRQMILNGNLPSGQKLPSTRKLSADLNVSRNTIIEAYGQLTAEGYLAGQQGSGTVVADGLHALDLDLAAKHCFSKSSTPAFNSDDLIDFRTGVPALEYFPRKMWGNLYREVCSKIPASGYGYCSAAGSSELRDAIAGYLLRNRGISCDPRQIIITSGSTQGLSLTSRVLQDEHKVVLIEDPSHPGLRKVISTAGCRIKGVKADNKGLCSELLDTEEEVSFVYTTPSHQYPLGGILPIQRRLELIRYAEQQNCYIVEDDYDSEFRYVGAPVSSLYELNPQRVIYLGSFSKILAPALRLGFMIVPLELRPAVKRLKMYSDVHSDLLGQYTLAEFINNGYFEKHIWKMKKLYSRNRNCLLNELTECFDHFEIVGQASGLHLVVRFYVKLFTADIVNEIAGKGVRIYRVGSYYLDYGNGADDKIILGYSHLSSDKITAGIKTVRNIIMK